MFYQTKMNSKMQQFYLFDLVSKHVVLDTVCFGGGPGGKGVFSRSKNQSKDNSQQQKHATATKHPFSRHTGKASGFGEDFLMPGLKKSWKKQML